MTKRVLIHCKEESLTNLLSTGLQFEYNSGEYDVIVNDIDSLDDEQFCEHYGIDYDLVNCIEAM